MPEALDTRGRRYPGVKWEDTRRDRPTNEGRLPTQYTLGRQHDRDFRDLFLMDGPVDLRFVVFRYYLSHLLRHFLKVLDSELLLRIYPQQPLPSPLVPGDPGPFPPSILVPFLLRLSSQRP